MNPVLPQEEEVQGQEEAKEDSAQDEELFAGTETYQTGQD